MIIDLLRFKKFVGIFRDIRRDILSRFRDISGYSSRHFIQVSGHFVQILGYARKRNL